jgi:hypothetical protein
MIYNGGVSPSGASTIPVPVSQVPGWNNLDSSWGAGLSQSPFPVYPELQSNFPPLSFDSSTLCGNPLLDMGVSSARLGGFGEAPGNSYAHLHESSLGSNLLEPPTAGSMNTFWPEFNFNADLYLPQSTDGALVGSLSDLLHDAIGFSSPSSTAIRVPSPSPTRPVPASMHTSTPGSAPTLTPPTMTPCASPPPALRQLKELIAVAPTLTPAGMALSTPPEPKLPLAEMQQNKLLVDRMKLVANVEADGHEGRRSKRQVKKSMRNEVMNAIGSNPKENRVDLESLGGKRKRVTLSSSGKTNSK